MNPQENEILNQAKKLVEKSGFPLSSTEIDELKVNDFGLGNLPIEGFTFVDLLRTEKVRITIMVLLPYQTLPQHKHPSYEGEDGKEENVRVLWGQFKVYDEGEEVKDLNIPEGKEAYYSSRNEHVLEITEQYSVQPNTAHWFQAGPEGAVVLASQNRVDENHNIFYDPASDGCPIPAANVS